MRKTLTTLLVATFALSGCSTVRDSRANPFNWFGSARTAPPPVREASPQTNPLIPKESGLFSSGRAKPEEEYLGRPFDQVADLVIEPVPGGAIIRATGVAARQGVYQVQLTPVNEGEEPVDGVLSYRLEGIPPDFNTRVGAHPSREVVAARKVTDQTLAGVTAIRVEGQRNAILARR
ncbi:MAG: hypothetical protein CML55_10595 [Rhodobacteraceae bacterium]|nr:hypothetical protein [Paracoccaceae bacterium]